MTLNNQKIDQSLSLRINFTPIPLSIWKEKFARLPRSTILQSYEYAQFLAMTSSLRPRWAMIEVDGVEVGMAQFFTAEIMGGLISNIILDRGPLWFTQTPNPAWVYAFFNEFAQLFPRRLGRARRVIPEVCRETPSISDSDFKSLGYHRVRTSVPYQTAWIDLTKDSMFLRAQLLGRWRNALCRAQQQEVQIDFSTDSLSARALIQQVTIDQKMRGYRGLSGAALARLVRLFEQGDGLLVARAQSKGEGLAEALFLRHGQCATWQSGWTGPAARRLGVGQRLLWESLLYLRQKGVAALDLGGYNDHDASGVKMFKVGLGGQHVTLLGHYS